jgi:beta-glucosidase
MKIFAKSSRCFKLAGLIVTGLSPAVFPAAAALLDDAAAYGQAKAVLQKLTLEEKISLCHGVSTFSINAIPHAGIPDELTMDDGPHNIRPEVARDTFESLNLKDDQSTSLPCLMAVAATWDVAMAAKHGHVLGQEARDRGKDIILAPGVNLLRTPLNGRNFEYYGECPVLSARMAVAEINAIQANEVGACVKHFALNNQELNRGGVDVEVAERPLREIYLPAFEAAVKEGKVLTLMNSYNRFRGEYCSQSNYLNQQILKDQWGFKGLVMTDWGGMHDTVLAALGGTDVETNSGQAVRYFKQPLLDAVKHGQVPESLIDDKALRVLYVMAKLHKLDGVKRLKGSRNTPEHQQAAREIAEASIVLLKNDQGVLPLDSKSIKELMVVGKLALEKNCHKGGSSGGKPPYEISAMEGLQRRLGPAVKVTFLPLSENEKGLRLSDIPDSALNTFDTQVRDAGLAVGAWQAEYFNSLTPEGTPALRKFDRKLKFDWKKEPPGKGVADRGFSARWTAKIIAPESGEYILSASGGLPTRVTIDGQPAVDNWNMHGKLRKRVGAVGKATLEAGKEYVVVVECCNEGRAGGFGLSWQLPSDHGLDPAMMKSQLAKADAVILFVGTGHAYESEGVDLQNMQLPKGQDEAVQAMIGINPRTVVVNLSGTPLEMPWKDREPALLQYWYGGMEAGNALAAVLFGEVNPSGKLPFTVPEKLADSPAHALADYKIEREKYAEGIFVGYRWFDHREIKPAFPFGYGLSYTSFSYQNARISSPTLGREGHCTVTVEITNTGSRAGAEVVQLYVHDTQPKIEKPVRELKNFAKVFLRPGETKTVSMDVTPRDFAYFDVAGKQWKAAAGDYELEIGASSRDLRQTARVSLPVDITESVP